MAKSLAIKYRPKTFDDVSEQDNIKIILKQQIETDTWKHAYLFCGSAGTGKTTCARIFANELGHGKSDVIERDAASNNGVADVDEIKRQANMKSIVSDYKVFILDECHAFSNSAWQQMLKILEEPPATSIFIFCTTDPQKIPKTIISRVQRYDFNRISTKAIVSRLHKILDDEGFNDMDKVVSMESLEYIAKLADGGMRDAITMLDKCISYNTDLSIENVVAALGTVDYEEMVSLTDDLLAHKITEVIERLEVLYAQGKDMKTFLKQYVHFLLDVHKYILGCDWKYIKIPQTDYCSKWLKKVCSDDSTLHNIIKALIKTESNIKYSSTPLYDLEASIIAM